MDNFATANESEEVSSIARGQPYTPDIANAGADTTTSVDTTRSADTTLPEVLTLLVVVSMWTVQ